MNSAPRLLVIGGILLLVFGVPLAWFGVGALQPPYTNLQEPLMGAMEAIVGLPLAFWGMSTMMQMRRFKAKSADEIKQQDTRPPVIYLRSFKDDQKGSTVTLMGGLAATAIFPSYVTEEEQIATAINQIGPFLAIGQPGEPILDMRDIHNNTGLTEAQKKRAERIQWLKLALRMGPLIFLMPRDKVLPDLGAARMYVGDHEWQDKVKGLLSAAQLVVLRAGETDNLLWEVETVARSVAPERIVFLLPFSSQKSYDVFRQKVSQFFPKPFPEKYRPRFMKYGSVKGVLYFERDWTPKIVILRDLFFAFDSFFMPVVPRLHAALQPVYAQLNLPYKKNQVNPWIITVNIVGCLLVVLCILVSTALPSSQP